MRYTHSFRLLGVQGETSGPHTGIHWWPKGSEGEPYEIVLQAVFSTMPAAMKFVFLRPSLEQAAAFAAWHEVHVPIVVSMGQAVLYLIANISFELNNLCVHVYKYRPSTRPIPPPPLRTLLCM